MYTEPIICQSNDLSKRAYISVVFKGKRLRFYSGNIIGIRCFPNEAKTHDDRLRLLKQLHFEVKKSLQKGWDPLANEKTAVTYAVVTTNNALMAVLNEVQTEDLSSRYRYDLLTIGRQLQQFLTQKKLHLEPISSLSPATLQLFLTQFNSSSTYYMTKRRTLTGLFKRMVDSGVITTSPVKGTSRKKEVHTLNVPYSEKQLKALLNHLQKSHPNLFLCALLMYGCFLRPHREIRLLKRRHLNDNCTTITLSGHENKSKRVRVIHLPAYVTKALLEYGTKDLLSEEYLMSRNGKPVNKDYFKTLWTRQKKLFPAECQLLNSQTLYSFRHTGAVAVYHKTKDPYRVQQAMFHSSLKVTLTYLRSLGLISDNNLSDLPDVNW